jgi:hypothetical protein
MLTSRMTNKYVKSTVSSNLLWHIKALHCDLWDANTAKYGWKNLDSTKSIVKSQGGPHEEFNMEKFHQWLVNFIVVDDQVGPFCSSDVLVFLTALLPRRLI